MAHGKCFLHQTTLDAGHWLFPSALGGLDEHHKRAAYPIKTRRAGGGRRGCKGGGARMQPPLPNTRMHHTAHTQHASHACRRHARTRPSPQTALQQAAPPCSSGSGSSLVRRTLAKRDARPWRGGAGRCAASSRLEGSAPSGTHSHTGGIHPFCYTRSTKNAATATTTSTSTTTASTATIHPHPHRCFAALLLSLIRLPHRLWPAMPAMAAAKSLFLRKKSSAGGAARSNAYSIKGARQQRSGSGGLQPTAQALAHSAAAVLRTAKLPGVGSVGRSASWLAGTRGMA